MLRLRAPRRVRPRSRSQAGATLIEVLVAVVLLTVGMVGMLGLLAHVIGNSNDAQDRNRAALLANELATAMWLNGSTDVTTGNLHNDWTNWLATAGDPTNGKGLNLVGTPTVAPVTAGVGTGSGALITIQWKAPHKSAASAATTGNVTQETVNTYTTQVVLP